MQSEPSAVRVASAPSWRSAVAPLVAVTTLMWLAGAATIRRVRDREVGTYGLEQTPAEVQGDPIWLVPSLLT
jgi:hypothetical protein